MIKVPSIELAKAADNTQQPASGVSILMSTYAREKASNLAASLESLRIQSRPADQIVLVIDGPVDGEQEKVIADFAALQAPWEFTVLRLERNGGLARALNAGLAAATMPIIMRMDSDDICLPDRIAIECDYLEANPEIGLVTSWAEEFYDERPDTRLRVAPTTHEAIVQALRWRNIIVHPAVAVRADLLRAVGGYNSKFGLLEDYDLWIRMAMSGVQFHVIPKALIRARTGLGLNERRGGWRYVVNEVRFRLHFFKAGFLTVNQFLMVTTLYTGFRLISGPMRGRLYAFVRS
ncbi:glycosyltransferase [Neorhizobium sp. P12A]|jgi:GT2 family glycosyltransferase|uniref:glycosyltransferase n=1 Tax=Rhizobium/Agrobacterium group TaxID=227290 RepID=UPI00104D8E64|nr:MULTISPECIES: glycosyltransferase [Rhizobium/Agrobacterium group]KAA0691403.1 glycosyltransferase [Neorhizobium sp. P12A]TCR73230.1 GT2 family glycosyltransferase [Rhizobium sp. BK376]